MVRLSLAATLLAAVGTAQAALNSPSVLRGAYIVEYEDNHVSDPRFPIPNSRLPGARVATPSHLVTMFETDHRGQDSDSFISSLGVDASKRMDLNYKLFKGASIQLKDVAGADDKAAIIAKMPAVKKMWPVKLYNVPEHTVHYVGKPGQDAGLLKRQAADNGKDVFTPHVMTQVDKLRAQGIVGKGIKIAIVDTGVRTGSA